MAFDKSKKSCSIGNCPPRLRTPTRIDTANETHGFLIGEAIGFLENAALSWMNMIFIEAR